MGTKSSIPGDGRVDPENFNLESQTSIDHCENRNPVQISVASRSQPQHFLISDVD